MAALDLLGFRVQRQELAWQHSISISRQQRLLGTTNSNAQAPWRCGPTLMSSRMHASHLCDGSPCSQRPHRPHLGDLVPHSSRRRVNHHPLHAPRCACLQGTRGARQWGRGVRVREAVCALLGHMAHGMHARHMAHGMHARRGACD